MTGRPHTAMPLGGIGTGHVAIGSDGGLRQWQLHGRPNHQGTIPNSFFAIRASRLEPPFDVVRVLQSVQSLESRMDPTPLVTDRLIPGWQQDLLRSAGGVEATEFDARYPHARVDYLDSDLSVDVRLEAWNPLIPLDSASSGIPAAVFDFTITNNGDSEVYGCLAGSLQNAIGWDGYGLIDGSSSPLYGGNVNRLVVRPGWTSLNMENVELSESDARNGQMVLLAVGDAVVPNERWSTVEQSLDFLRGTSFGHERPEIATSSYLRDRHRTSSFATPTGASPRGQTWNGSLAVPYRVSPGEVANVTFVLSWHFPNRYVDFDQFGPPRDYGKSKFWLGTEYATRFVDAQAVAEEVLGDMDRLRSTSILWADMFATSTMPDWLAQLMRRQSVVPRTSTCLRTEDGNFFGFEGGMGASTSMWGADRGGSCPLNCTHVWNYEQALSRFYPDLERTMRQVELEVMQAPSGYLPHRVILPLYLRQLWDEPSAGPVNPALDGMLGCVLKVYREVRQGAPEGWLERLWPRVTALIDYVVRTFDTQGDGVFRGEQPNTFDISFRGANMFIGGLWLAALRAYEQLAELVGDRDVAADARERFGVASSNYDRLLWNGEYYVQETEGSTVDQFGAGCLSDQLLGQWWAHQLELGYLLPREHVRSTLRSVIEHNFKSDFTEQASDQRLFADGTDAGLVLCTWPHGGRPDVPMRYCDEVWTGSEYAVAALCLYEGMTDSAHTLLQAIHARYDGRRRNPYNEIEAGDHYARSMAGWSVMEAYAGWRYDATRAAATVRTPRDDATCQVPILAATGWGSVEVVPLADAVEITLRCAWGQIAVAEMALMTDVGADSVAIALDGSTIGAAVVRDEARGANVAKLLERVVLSEGTTLRVVLSNDATS